MVNTIILHTGADADRANWLAQAWSTRSCIACRTEAKGERLSFGKHMVVLGLWSPTTENGAEASALLGAVKAHGKRAFLLLWDLPAPPPEIAATGAPIIFASGARKEDIAKLSAVASRIETGHLVATEHVAKPPERSAPTAMERTAPRRTSWRKRREAEIAAERMRQVRARPVDLTSMRRARKWGYIVGAALGLIAIIGALGPWAASLATR